MAILEDQRPVLSTVLIIVLLLLGCLFSTACDKGRRGASTESPTGKGPDQQGEAIDNEVAASRPSKLAGSIFDDITAETEDANVAGPASAVRRLQPRAASGNRVRFIRLQYDGSSSWNINMGPGGDYNMLLKFKEITGIPVADNTESREISRLAKFRKGAAPPFVYITGTGAIELLNRDAQVLRSYCLDEGGMIIADNGGGSFERSFRAVCTRLFPGKRLVDIPDDDPLYGKPFAFPSGPPNMGSAGGEGRPVGIKHEGRWIVFYHPGNMGGLWKTGHSGAAKAVADRIYKLGVNLMYYNFVRYLDRHHPPAAEAGR